jgi:hypothetical protein
MKKKKKKKKKTTKTKTRAMKATTKAAKPLQHATPYAVTKKQLPEDIVGQKRAVYDAVRAGAISAIALRDAMSKHKTFDGASETTVKQNVAWYVARLRKDGFVKESK